jgi:chromosome partitioning protein
MPVITMASSKGGCGKSTAAILLATELAGKGAGVTIVDADPNRPLARWGKRPGKPERLNIVDDVTEETLIDAIEEAAKRVSFVIVDLEGTASLMVAQAMSRSDLVIVPTKGSALDAIEAYKAVRFIRFQERNYRRTIPFAILFTQTSAAIRPRTQISIETEFVENNVPMFDTQLHERDAYRALFTFGGTLANLDASQVRNIPAAISNARAFMGEVISRLDALTARAA